MSMFIGEALAGDGKTLADQADPLLVLERAQCGYGRRDGIADLQHAEAVPVKELKTRVVRTQLSPQLPDAEPLVTHIGVVEQDDRLIAELRPPFFEIFARRLIAVEAVNMEKVDRAVREIGQRFVESHT